MSSGSRLEQSSLWKVTRAEEHSDNDLFWYRCNADADADASASAEKLHEGCVLIEDSITVACHGPNTGPEALKI
jgi:hypothetical protein